MDSFFTVVNICYKITFWILVFFRFVVVYIVFKAYGSVDILRYLIFNLKEIELIVYF
jgi:hypothetical protein